MFNCWWFSSIKKEICDDELKLSPWGVYNDDDVYNIKYLIKNNKQSNGKEKKRKAKYTY